MASIDELHWSAILDTADFDKKAAKLRDEAKALNKSLSDMLDIYSKFKGKTLITEKGVTNAKELSSVLSEISKKMSDLPSSVKVYEDATKKANKEVERTTQHYTTQSGLLRQLTSLAGTYFSVRGVQSFLKSLIDVTGQFEVQKMALTSMLQSSRIADDIFNQYRKMALNSPYSFQDFTKFGKQLTAFNIPAQELIGTTKMLADVAAGLGVDMGRIILAYGQIKSAGVLKGTELRQLTEAGVPILDSLAKQIEETTGKTVKLADVFQMISKKQIPFEMVEKAFKDMTSEGGKFYNMQEVLVETLQGKIQKLRDTWQQMLYDLGRSEGVNSVLKGGLDYVTRLISNYETLGRTLIELIAVFTTYKVTLIALESASGAFELANHKILSSLKAIGSWISKNPYAIIAATITAASFAVYKSIKDVNKQANRMKDIIRDNDKALGEEVEKLDELNVKLKLNKKGTKEWNDAKEEVVSTYGQYFNGLDNEIEKVGDLSTAYDLLKTSIIDATRARQIATFQQQEEDRINEHNKELLEGIRKTIYKKYSRAEAYMIMDEVQRVLNVGGHIGDLMQNSTVSKLLDKSSDRLKADINSLFASNRGARMQYMNDLRTLIKEYGLEGTELDPDFNGPTPKKTSPKTGVTKQKVVNTGEEIAASISEWDKVIEDLDKQLLKDIDDGTKEFDKAFDDRMKAMKDFDDFLDKLEHTQSAGGGEGAANKARDFISGYKKADYKVLEEYRKQLGNLKLVYGENSVAYDNAKRKLDQWRASAEAANKSDLFEKMKGLADDIFKEGMIGYDLTNWSDKTLEQIRDIKKAINGLEVPDDMKKDVASVDGLLDHIVDALNRYKQSYANNTANPEEWKAQLKSAKKFASYISLAATSMQKLGEAMNSSNLSGFAEMLGNLSDTWQAIIEGGERGGLVGALIAGATSFIDKFINYLSEAKREETAILDAISETAREAGRIRFDESLRDGVKSLFGDDTLKSITSATLAIKGLSDEWDKLMDIFGRVKEAEISQYVRATSGGGGQGVMLAKHSEALRNAINGVEDLVFNNGSAIISIKQAAAELGYELVDGFNNINPALLDEIIKVYNLEEAVKRNRVDKDTLDYFKALSEYAKEYAEAMGQIEDAVSEVFGDVADSMVDSFIENFKSIGDAVGDIGDAFTDLGETIVKSMLKSYILDTILKKYEDEAKGMMMDYSTGSITYEDLAQRVSVFADSVTADTEKARDYINAMLAAFRDNDLLNMGEENSNTVANGIKGITEDTASLLASYINAVRADVSMIRAMEAVGWKDVNGILSSVGVLPTLNDYVAQVAATTANIAENTRALVDRIDRITTSASGRAALAVDVQ